MNNEEKILNILETMQKSIGNLAQGQVRLEQGQENLMFRQEKLEARQGKLEQNQEKLEARQGKLEQNQEKLEARQGKLEARQEKLEGIVVRIENDHGKKLQALFDGNVQLNQQLERIIENADRDHDFLIRRVK